MPPSRPDPSGLGVKLARVKFERNAPCPCGSGVKFKRCCGRDGAAQQALEGRIEACAQAVALPALTPLLRPTSDMFDAWAQIVGFVPEPPPLLLDAGVVAMGEAERARLVRECERVCGAAWTSLRDEVGGDETAVELLLRGAVRAGLLEREPVPRSAIDELLAHDEICGEPPCTLSMVVSGPDLWSIVEAAEAGDSAAGLEAEAERRWSDSHDRRLDRILDLLREKLQRHPEALAVVEEARAALDPELRLALAALLLGDAVEIADALLRAA